jgi:hypothetical protein
MKAGTDYDFEDNKRWDDFTRIYKAIFPTHALAQKVITLRELASEVDVDWYYDFYYRLYCKFTHAALAAITGFLNDTDSEDNLNMAASIQCGVEAVKSTGGITPNLISLRERLSALAGSVVQKNHG